MTLVAGVDSSTQSCKVVIRDLETGALVRSGRASHPDGTEVDPAAWWSALGTAIGEAGGLDDVAAIAVGGQQHGMVVLDADGRVIRPALLWNDTRSAAAAAELAAEVGAAEYARRAGSVPVASFTATKVRWLRDAEPENASRVAAVALPHDWLTWRLLGYGPADEAPLGPQLDALVTDRSDASGTAYWSPAADSYDLGLFELALGRPAREAAGADASAAASEATRPGTENDGAPRTGDADTDVFDSDVSAPVVLPRVLGPADSAGTAAEQNGEVAVKAGIIVGPGAGDNAGAALGLGAASGDVVVSLGTSGTVFAVVDESVPDATGAAAGFADASGRFLPLVATLNAARVLGTVADLLDVDFDELAELALRAPAGSEGVVLVPYFEGERTPNLPTAKASLHGLSIASTRRENIARAAVEGMLSGLAAGLDAVRAVGVREQRLLLVGGAALNPAVQAVAAQVFDAPVVVPAPGEYVANGAAAQAAWVLSGSRPEWLLEVVAEPAPDFRPVIREQYERYARLAAL
ncbi:FGGY family carbohydrate kinase [Humibacter albus]|uniref:FGGY family carbohydrate kinase n=1 Tax=Humibacter albus TaxID=427754 RepID=UPI0003B3B548|nr:FGGY family carbohydrate kinase [Humibacter albus]